MDFKKGTGRLAVPGRKMKKRLCFLIILALCAGCRKAERGSGSLTVVTSIFPVYDMIRQVAAESIDLYCLVPTGANPHQYEMAPSQAAIVSRARCFIGVHPEFDGWMERFLPDNTKIYYLVDAAGSSVNAKGDQAGHEDPHIWLSVRKAKDLTRILEGALSDIRPDQHIAYKARADQFIQRLDSLDAEIHRRFEPLKHRSLIQWHPAWNRFADDYHLAIAGTVERGHGYESSVKHFQQLIRNAREKNVRIVVAGLYQENRAVETLIREIDGRLVRLDTLGDPEDPMRRNYIAMMDWNAKKLAEALESL